MSHSFSNSWTMPNSSCRARWRNSANARRRVGWTVTMIDALGQYKILELAGAGTLGEVYRARDNRVRRTVAITVVTDQIASNPGLREKFLRQARAAAALSHPNIVTLYEVRDDGDVGLYLIYEFIEGQTLKTI